MLSDEIEAVLGQAAVDAVEQAIEQAFVAGRGRAAGKEAVHELLLGMLAAVIITPADGATDRARLCAGRLVDLVDVALAAPRRC